MKKILYFGNNLVGKKYPTTIETLSSFLSSENYEVYCSSSKNNKLLRLLDMIFTFFKKGIKTDIILIDTYSTTNFYYAFIISQLAKIFKIKYIPILHGGNLPNRLQNSPKLSSMIFTNSWKNIAPSNYLKEAFDKENYKTVYIPNNIELENYPFKNRKKLEPKLYWVRAFAKIYNPWLAIDVLKELQKDYPNAKLCMVGPDRDGCQKDVEKYIDDLELRDSVEITGILSKEDWHKKSEDFDVFINTTNVDNTPVSVIEAMALGLPIVSTNVGGLPYLLENDKDSILVSKQNKEEMISAIKLLLDNPGKVSTITKNAREKVESFDWNVVKEKWFEILQ
ncbi:glycosyltransferase family 4 protein [Aureivirga sp. CE67]|uniref:glycosyltransferase family 4 protein n=1 Tax=Aureivirga sp. CE67 TaxID=1788983 RepID=UPI0018C974B8|nr:glycosyltransferase family 4 protein [Aureivirga sp. CE67]